MRHTLRYKLAVFASLICMGVVTAADREGERTPTPKEPARSAAYEWLDIILEASAMDVDRYSPRPTVLSRTMAIPVTAMYDAWAAYDAKAVGTRLGGSLRRPAAERTAANREKAIAYATYRALLDVYAKDATWLAEQMRKKGYDPADASIDPATPQASATPLRRR